MKRIKKIVGLVLAMVMVIAMAVPVMAEETFSLTITNSAAGHTYEAYQIFKGDIAHVNGKDVLSNIQWGSSISNPSNLLNEINNNSTLSTLHTSTNDAKGLAEKLQHVTSDSETIDLFAEIVGKYLGSPVASTTTNVISGISAGYYLIKDEESSLDNKQYVYTKYILRVLKNETVSPKGDAPSGTLLINDQLNGTYTTIQDYDINDDVYYKCSGSFPSNLKSYERYYYKFNLTLPNGIQYKSIEQLYIEGADGNVVHVLYDITDNNNNNNTLPGRFNKDGQNISLEIDNMFDLYQNILPSHKLILKCKAYVTRDAAIATAMVGSLQINFTNNPNQYGVDPNNINKGTTVVSTANAFTFQINIDKYDADDANKKLNNAQFKLYYERIENDTNVKYYAQAITQQMIDGRVEINGNIVQQEDKGVIYKWTTDENLATVFITEPKIENGAEIKGYLEIKGLDSGIYYLRETVAPAGYNVMETPVQIKIIPTYTESEGNATVTVSYEVDSIAQASATVGVRNSAGTTLPVTGGIGTTIFYVAGGVLVLAAVVLLVTRKRMEK